MNKLFLKCSFNIQEKYVNADRNSIDFVRNKKIVFKLQSGEQIAITFKRKNDVNLLICSAMVEKDVGLKRYNAFLEHKKEYDQLKKLKYPSDSIEAFLCDNQNTVTELAKKLYQTIRWRYNICGGNEWVRFHFLEASIDKIHWIPLSLDKIGFKLHVLVVLERKEIRKLMKQGEPLHNELWHEAYGLLLTNPRSSLLIGVTALEVAIKQFIMYKMPKSDWIINNIQSPPLVKLLSDFIPTLETSFNLPDKVIDEMKKIVFERNKLVHSGIEPKVESLENRLFLIKDILASIDYFMGNNWAIGKSHTLFRSEFNEKIYKIKNLDSHMK
jgi:hypothetical protein